MPELVNFGFSLAQQVMPYLTEVRGTKAPFKLANVLGFVKTCAASSVGKKEKEGPEQWEAVSAFFTRIVEELNKLIALATEHENVFKSTLLHRLSYNFVLNVAQSRARRHGSSA